MDSVGPGLVHRIAGRDICIDLLIAHLAEFHIGLLVKTYNVAVRVFSGRYHERHPGEYLMGTTRKRLKHPVCVGFVNGFSEDTPVYAALTGDQCALTNIRIEEMKDD